MSYSLAIDIGTTNIEYALFDKSSKEIVDSTLSSNCNRHFGLDVMTRIDNATKGALGAMSKELKTQLQDDIIAFTKGIDLASINIAANTTMVHILMEYDCEPLSHFPFEPAHIEKISTDTLSLGIYKKSIPVSICSGLSAFIGGDIVSGLSTLDNALLQNSDILYIDLGTNAEMVYITTNSVSITSAAAGNTFETCSKGQASAVIKALSIMLKEGIVDESGLLNDKFFDNGYIQDGIFFTQKKIRDIQLAKSAIATGIEIILSESAYKKNDNILFAIAGNLGINLDYESAISIGLLPRLDNSSFFCIGNASLQGAISGFENIQSLPSILSDKKIKDIKLSNHKDFNDKYVANMYLK